MPSPHPLRFFRIFALALLVAAPMAAAGFEGDGPWVVRAWFGDDAMVREVASWGEHFGQDRKKGFIWLVAGPSELSRLRALGFFVEIDAGRTEAIRAAEAAQSTWDQPESIPGFPCYRTVEETFATATGLVAEYPTLASWSDIGDSWDKVTPGGPAGYDMMVLRLTNSAIPGPKPKLLVTGGIHAREYTTAEAATRFAEWILGAYGTDADATWVLDSHEIHLVLQANPDGRKQAETGDQWRKNRNNTDGCVSTYGVDLNRNFPFYWGQWGGSSGNSCSETFRGSSAGSEPETQAIAGYMNSIFPDQRPDDLITPAPDDAEGIYVDIHSFGQDVLSAWGQTTSPICNGAPPLWPPNCDQILRLGRKWAYLSGYDPRVGSLYAVDGSTKDYSYGHLGVPGYTWELGSSFFEGCGAFEATVLPDALAMLRYAMKVPRTPYQTPAGPDAVAVTVPAAPVDLGAVVDVTATIDDTRYLDPDGTEPSQPIAEAEIYLNELPWTAGATPLAMSPVDGAFDETVEPVTVSIDTSSLGAGRHALFVRGRDDSPAWGAGSATFLYVIDPSSSPVVQGTVTEEGTGAPLSATVQVGPFQASTDPGTGAYSIQVPPGTYDLVASAPPDHAPQTIPGVVLSDLQVLDQDFQLLAYFDVFFDDVESGNIGWTTDSPPWEITTSQSHSPTHSWTDSLGTNYPNNVDTSLVSPLINLAGATDAELAFWHRYSTESGYDYCQVEVSTDGVQWTGVASFDGSQTSWVRVVVPVPMLAGAPQAQFRFRLTSDTSVTSDGWYVDDVELRAALPQGALQDLSVSVVGNGQVTSSPAGISCPPGCQASFADGTPVTLTPSPSPGWAFSGWSGDCTGSGGCTVTMDQARSVTATFVEVFWTLDVAVAGPGAVTSSPAGISCPGDCTEDYADGTMVGLTATPGPDAHFVAWSGACSGTGACNVSMTMNRSVTAGFDTMPFADGFESGDTSAWSSATP